MVTGTSERRLRQDWLVTVTGGGRGGHRKCGTAGPRACRQEPAVQLRRGERCVTYLRSDQEKSRLRWVADLCGLLLLLLYVLFSR